MQHCSWSTTIRRFRCAFPRGPSATMSDNSNVDDSAASARSTNEQTFRRFITVKGRGVLDNMLNQLGFSPALYEHAVYGDNKICVTIIFQPSNLSSSAFPVPTRISGVRSLDGDLAEKHGCCCSY